MKQAIRQFLLNTRAASSRRHNAASPGNDIVVCCAPVPEGNRGDQALLAAVVDTLRRGPWKKIHLVQTASHPILAIREDGRIRIHAGYWPVFTSPHCFREQLAWARFLRGKGDVVLIGADVLDEHYSVARSEGSFYAMHLAARCGCPTRIIGFSVNGAPSPALRGRFLRAQQDGTKLCVRDSLSHQRLHDAGIKSAQLVGDLALLMRPACVEELDAGLREFIRNAPGPVVGLNFTEIVMGSGAETDALLERITDACARLAHEDGCRFVCIPHDEQGGIEYLASFHAKMSGRYPGIAALVAPMPSAQQLKCIAGQCAHVFTCRLHLGIATLGMGRPVTGFPYQGKFEGQFEHFGLSDGLIYKDQLPGTVDGMTEIFRRRIQSSDDLARRVRDRLPAVQALSMKNFAGLPCETASVDGGQSRAGAGGVARA